MKKKIDSLQALRALACLVVFADHSGLNCAVAAAVGVFFMLSGFTLSLSSWEKAEICGFGAGDSLRYAVKKISKLYILHLICSLPVLVLDLVTLLGAYSAAALTAFVKKIIATVFLIQSWFPNSDIALAFNGVAWYLSTAMFLYFAFPAILRGIKKVKSSSSLLFVAVLIYIVQFSLGFIVRPLENILLGHGLIPADGKFAYWFTYIFPPFRLMDFTVGCCLGAVFVKDENRASRKKSLGFELCCILLLVLSSLIYRRSDSFVTTDAFVYTQLFVPLAAVAVYTFALGRGPVVKLLTNRFTMFMSKISSDFFLLHQNIIRFTVMFLSYFMAFSTIKKIVPLLCFAMTLVACLIWQKLQTMPVFRKKA